MPFIAAVRERFPDLVISVDTWRHEVGRGLCGGCRPDQRTWAGADPQLAEVAAEFGVGIVCSHTGGAQPRTDPHRVRYTDVVAEVRRTGGAGRADGRAGRPEQGVLIDPTHDFGKNTWHGLELLRRLDELVGTGWPVLMALSNKDFIGETLDRAERSGGRHARGDVGGGLDWRGCSERTRCGRPVRWWRWWRASRDPPARPVLRALA